MTANVPSGSQARHPSARAVGGHLRQPASRVAEMLPGVVGLHRDIAVATVAFRGDQSRSQWEFAQAYGLSETLVRAIEAGEVSGDGLPAPLRVLTSIADLAARLGLAPVMELARPTRLGPDSGVSADGAWREGYRAPHHRPRGVQ